MCTLHGNQYTFMIFRSLLLTVRHVSNESYGENRKMDRMFNNFFSRKSCRLWDNVKKYGRARQVTGDNIMRRMHFACWITNATNTHTEYVILTTFLGQQWLRERASMLRLYVYFLSCYFCFCLYFNVTVFHFSVYANFCCLLSWTVNVTSIRSVT